MSTVYLHVGQCGNQIGQKFWQTVNKAQSQSLKQSNTFEDSSGIQHSLHIDSEPKVIWNLTKSLKVREKNVITGKRGRGTNWALGYHGQYTRGDDHLLEDALDSLRREIERCDKYMGIVLMHSLSGGTGAGLGSRLCESLRDEYPMNYLMSCAVTPCANGESPLQHYNSLLTLAHLQKYCDGIILLHNDDILRSLQKKADTSVSFSQMNQAIVNNLCGVFLPTDSLTPKSGYSLGMEPLEMLRLLCPVPSLKFIHTIHNSRSKLSWEGLVTQTLHGLQKYDRKGQHYGCISNLVVGRGDSKESFLAAMKRGAEGKIKAAYNCVSWNPFPTEFWAARRNFAGTKDSASVTIAANYGSVIEYLQLVYDKSKVMHEAGAYLHWYNRYSLGEETFGDAFETISSVIRDYKDAFT